MNILKFMADRQGTSTFGPIACRDGTITIRFSRRRVLPDGLKDWTEMPVNELIKHLRLLTSQVTLVVRSPETQNKESQLTLPVEEAVEILGGEVPCDANFTRVCRRFLDRKHHGGPVQPTEPPERSYGAQGQTKKPGSHSQDKHK